MPKGGIDKKHLPPSPPKAKVPPKPRGRPPKANVDLTGHNKENVAPKPVSKKRPRSTDTNERPTFIPPLIPNKRPRRNTVASTPSEETEMDSAIQDALSGYNRNLIAELSNGANTAQAVGGTAALIRGKASTSTSNPVAPNAVTGGGDRELFDSSDEESYIDYNEDPDFNFDNYELEYDLDGSSEASDDVPELEDFESDTEEIEVEQPIPNLTDPVEDNIMNETIISKKKVALENGGFVYVKQKDRTVRGIVVGWTYRCQKHGNCNVRCHVERDNVTNSYIRTKKFNYPHYHLAEPTAAANMKVSLT